MRSGCGGGCASKEGADTPFFDGQFSPGDFSFADLLELPKIAA
jgi:hypothetical protein